MSLTNISRMLSLVSTSRYFQHQLAPVDSTFFYLSRLILSCDPPALPLPSLTRCNAVGNGLTAGSLESLPGGHPDTPDSLPPLPGLPGLSGPASLPGYSTGPASLPGLPLQFPGLVPPALLPFPALQAASAIPPRQPPLGRGHSPPRPARSFGSR